MPALWVVGVLAGTHEHPFRAQAMTTDEIRFRVGVLHAGINELVAGNLTTGGTTATERIDIAISALISALGEAVTGLNVNPDGVVAQLREQIRKLTQ